MLLFVLSAYGPPWLIIGTEVLRQLSFGLSGPIFVGHDGRRCRLRRVEDRPPRQRTVTSAVVFALWAGLALGGAVAGWLLSFYGFESKSYRAVRVCAIGHRADRQCLCGPGVLCLRRLA